MASSPSRRTPTPPPPRTPTRPPSQTPPFHTPPSQILPAHQTPPQTQIPIQTQTPPGSQTSTMQALSVTGMRSPSMINPQKQLLKEKSTNLVVITIVATLFFAPVVVPSDPVTQTRIICFHKFCFSLTYLLFSCFFGLGFDRCLCNLTMLVTGTSSTLSSTINFLRVGFLVAVAANSNWVLISPLSVIFVCGVYRVYKHIQYAHNPPVMIAEAPSDRFSRPEIHRGRAPAFHRDRAPLAFHVDRARPASYGSQGASTSQEHQWEFNRARPASYGSQGASTSQEHQWEFNLHPN